MAAEEKTETVVDGTRAIRSLRVFSSGWAEQHDEHRYGSWKPQLWWALTSRSWVELPLSYFLIEHKDGPILFDAGMDPAIVSDPDYISQAIGRFLFRRVFRMHISEEDQLDKVLANAGFVASDIELAIISHLHFDHVGGIAHIPQARLLVSEREWAQLAQPNPEREWILKEHIEIPGAQWRPFAFHPTDDPLFDGFEGTYDVKGDGSMILLPTPGHTPILLVGDLTYEARLLDEDRTPGRGDPAILRASFAKVRNLKDRLPGLVIVPSHDFSAADEIARATRSEPAPGPG